LREATLQNSSRSKVLFQDLEVEEEKFKEELKEERFMI